MKPQQIFMKRSLSIYGGMKERAAKIGLEMPFTIHQLRGWLIERFNGDVAGVTRCEYSDELLTAETFSVDHRYPVSRGGSFGMVNLSICSQKQNLRKGNMSEVEYKIFREFVMARFAEVVQVAIWRKLEIGDVQRFSHFRRLKKAKSAKA